MLVGIILWLEYHYFHDTCVPTDMEWTTGPDSNEVDIGFMPLMRVVSTEPSFPWDPDTERPVVDVPFNESSITWDEEIPLQKAKVILERTLYPFKKVSGCG